MTEELDKSTKDAIDKVVEHIFGEEEVVEQPVEKKEPAVPVVIDLLKDMEIPASSNFSPPKISLEEWEEAYYCELVERFERKQDARTAADSTYSPSPDFPDHDVTKARQSNHFWQPRVISDIIGKTRKFRRNRGE